jgi:hypothetical protein
MAALENRGFLQEPVIEVIACTRDEQDQDFALLLICVVGQILYCPDVNGCTRGGRLRIQGPGPRHSSEHATVLQASLVLSVEVLVEFVGGVESTSDCEHSV